MAEFVPPAAVSSIFAGSGLPELMGPKNLKARGVTSAKEYVEKYSLGLVDWQRVSPDAMRRVHSATVRAKRACMNAGYVALSRMRWRFCLCDASVENGYPHTIGDVIIIPLLKVQRRLSDGDLEKLFVHEAVHVAQRRDPEGAYDLVIGEWGFRELTIEEAERVYGLGEARVNPDTDQKIYRLGSDICHPVFVSDPESLADIELLPSPSHPIFSRSVRNHEHPFEIMAETVANSVYPGNTS